MPVSHCTRIFENLEFWNFGIWKPLGDEPRTWSVQGLEGSEHVQYNAEFTGLINKEKLAVSQNMTCIAI